MSSHFLNLAAPTSIDDALLKWCDSCKDPEKIKKTLESGGDFSVNTVLDAEGRTAFHLALLLSCYQGANVAYSHGGNSNLKTNDGKTAVCQTIELTRNSPTIDNFRKIVLTLRDASEETLRTVVKRYLSTSINDPVISCSLETEGKQIPYKSTLVYLCVRACNLKGVEALLQMGANPVIPQLNSGSNCLHCAAYYRYSRLVALLCGTQFAEEMAAHTNHSGDIPLTDALAVGVPSVTLLALLRVFVPSPPAADDNCGLWRLKTLKRKKELLLECAKGEEQVTNKLRILFGDIQTDPSSVTEEISQPQVVEITTSKVEVNTTESVTNEVEPVSEKLSELATEEVAQPVVEEVSEPVTEAGTEEVAQPLTEESIEGGAETRATEDTVNLSKEVVDEEVSTVIKPDEWTPELSTEVDTEDNTAPRRRATEDTVNLLFALSSPIETGTVTQQHVDPSSITEQNETTSLPQTFETPEEEVGTEPVADKVESVAEKVPEPTPVNVEVEPVTEEIVQPVTQKEDLTHASEPVPVPEKTDPVTDAAEPEVGEPETEEVIEPATQKADPISDAAEPVSEPVAEEIVQPVTQKKDSVTNAAEPVPVPEETDPVTDEPETETQKADLVTEAAIPDPEEVVEAATKAVTEENIEPVTEVAVPADGKVSEPVSKEVIEPVNEEKVVEPATQKVEDDKPQTPVKSINTDGDETTEEGWIPIDSEQVPVEEQPAPVAKKGLMGNLFGYVLPKKK
eukprot:TRINITY_DN2364_c0_g2_i6.p1 TRINITY_DN2364_c0_g2~~TRINITY_DN2364_c0_g2_i6.p1  ORF type:complete len:739 (+),score=187.89 TRINITY_DN2364_c0_g2_i6:125-2341(+)